MLLKRRRASLLFSGGGVRGGASLLTTGAGRFPNTKGAPSNGKVATFRKGVSGASKRACPGKAKLFLRRGFVNDISMIRGAGAPAPPLVFPMIRPPSGTQIIRHGSPPGPAIGAEKEQGKKPTALTGAMPFSRTV
jgi:hypothetical protein